MNLHGSKSLTRDTSVALRAAMHMCTGSVPPSAPLIKADPLTMLPSTTEKLLMLYGKRFPFQRGKLRVIDLLWRAALANGDTRRVATLRYGGFKVPCDISEMLQRQFYFFGTY